MAYAVDFAHDALAQQEGIGRMLDNADKFMPEHAQETHIAALYLNVRVTDARRKHLHQRLTGPWHRHGHIVNPELFLEYQCFHGNTSLRGACGPFAHLYQHRGRA